MQQPTKPLSTRGATRAVFFRLERVLGRHSDLSQKMSITAAEQCWIRTRLPHFQLEGKYARVPSLHSLAHLERSTGAMGKQKGQIKGINRYGKSKPKCKNLSTRCGSHHTSGEKLYLARPHSQNLFARFGPQTRYPSSEPRANQIQIV